MHIHVATRLNAFKQWAIILQETICVESQMIVLPMVIKGQRIVVALNKLQFSSLFLNSSFRNFFSVRAHLQNCGSLGYGSLHSLGIVLWIYWDTK